ncbi:MAG: hypothetical protein IPP32_04415 [Bacteroidetes bacterium]|nr:hypothetical protein [Bacteroidota bacterium]
MAAIEFHKGSGESLAKFISTLKSKYLFYGVFLANIIFLFSIELYPSSDGAAHLYNSNLIYHLIKGDSEIINTFFVFNTIPVPNWMDHFFWLAYALGFQPTTLKKFFYSSTWSHLLYPSVYWCGKSIQLNQALVYLYFHLFIPTFSEWVSTTILFHSYFYFSPFITG